MGHIRLSRFLKIHFRYSFILSLILSFAWNSADAQSPSNAFIISSFGGNPFNDWQSTNQFSDNFGYPGPDVWYTLELTQTTEVNISLCGSSFDTFLWVLDNNIQIIASNDDNGPNCTGSRSSISQILPAGTYYIVADGHQYPGGDLSISVTFPGFGDLPLGADMNSAIDAGTFSGTGNFNDTRVNDDGLGDNIGQPTPDIYYKFTLTGTSQVTISHCDSSIDTYMHLLDISGNVIMFNDDNSNAFCHQAYIQTILPAGTYYVVSEGYYESGVINTTIEISDNLEPPPVISYSLASSISIGSAVNFSPINTGGAAFGDQITSTLAGNSSAGSRNGTGSAARFNNPLSTAVDAAGNVYVADAGNHSIRKISPAGVVTTLAGAGYAGFANGTGTSAVFQHPSALAVDASGNVYVSDQQNHRIRKITPSGVVSTFAGSGSIGFANGAGTTASFNYPMGLAFDAVGNLYVSDAFNHKIRKITPIGLVSNFAGSGTAGNTNGTALSSSFNHPMDLAFDVAGNLYVADRNNNMIRKVSTSGIVTTLAGSGVVGSDNAKSVAASFNSPHSVSVDTLGNVYVADRLNNMIRKIEPSGMVSTLAGTLSAGSVDGSGAIVRFNSPYGLSRNAEGNLYVAENSGNKIRKITITQAYTISPALPAELIFDHNTGAISGTPTVESPPTTYTVTASNSAGSSTTTFSLAVTLAVGVIAPSQDQNYVLTYVPKKAGMTTTEAVKLASTDKTKVQVSIDYFDGLGRPMQTVMVKGSADGTKDIVQPVAYDAFGRAAVRYLPYASSGSPDGSYKSSALNPGAGVMAFYNPTGSSGKQQTNGVMRTEYPFSRTVFEASPLNRVLEQGAPGAVWQPADGTIPNSGRTLKTEHGTNDIQIGSAVKLWEIDNTGTTVTTTTSYNAGTLYKTVLKDENWISGKSGTTEEYKDLEGRVVLKRIWESETGALNTYYMYDDFGNLRFVIPPIVTANNFTLNDVQFNQYIYGYQYDGRNRLIRKKIPGKGWEELVYNRIDQMVLSQDSLQRTSAKRSFSKYDALGRMVISGMVTNQSLSRKNVQDTVNAKPVLWETRDATATHFHGYNNLSYPSQVTTLEPEVIQYYDDYNIPGIPFNHQNSYSNKTKGLPTATKVKVLGTNDFLWSVNYYDDEARVVKTYSQHYLSGSTSALNYDEISNSWSFTGELDTMIRVHHSTAGTTTIFNRYEYDHIGRKLTTRQAINSESQVLLSSNSYNEIGQLKQKQLHNQLQTTTYTYNERGWLKNSSSNEFNLQLQYEDGSVPQFNGNISNQVWARNGTTNNNFTYSYDKLNRLLSGISTGVNMNEVLTYDVMGNITSLKRDGQAGNYNYNGHQLSQISGSLLTTGIYAYDGNGNAITDGRNGVSLTYNSLNLPATVSKAGLSMTYIYDATGNKLKKINGNSTRNYIQGIEYQDNSIELIHTEEGLAQRNGSTYTYHYNLKDHLGNVRATFDVYQGTIRPLQTNDYYPFGLSKNPFGGSNNNKYLYNSKELQEELGQYDYGARFYDPVIGRWNVVDPMAEKYVSISPYVYVANNPIRLIDPNGMEIVGDVDEIERFKKEAEMRIASEAKRQERLQGKIDKKSASGKSTSGLEQRLARSQSVSSEMSGMLGEISTMEKSDQIYNVITNYTGTDSDGETRYNPSTGAVDVMASNSYLSGGGLAHELTHAYQFETGKIDFDKKNGGPGVLYDITDEISAYKRQFAFTGNNTSVTENYVRGLKNQNGAFLYKNVPGGNLNTSSTLLMINYYRGGIPIPLLFSNSNSRYINTTNTLFSNFISR